MLVAFEGIDGSGKSTAVRHVHAALARDGVPVVATREETDGPTGEWVRRSIAEGWDPVATTFLFAADRARHAGPLRAWLAEGRVVLCDRYVHSTLAYQGVTLRGRVPDPRRFVAALHEGWMPQPDHVLLFVGDPVRCVERTARRGAQAAYEKASFLAQVQQEYQDLARQDGRFAVLDAEVAVDTLCAAAERQLRSWLSAASA